MIPRDVFSLELSHQSEIEESHDRKSHDRKPRLPHKPPARRLTMQLTNGVQTLDAYQPTFDPGLDVATVVFSHIECVKTRASLAKVSKLWRDASKPTAGLCALPRGAQGTRPFQNRAHRSSPRTGVELDVPRGVFPAQGAQGFAADLLLRSSRVWRASSPTTSFVSWTMIVCGPWEGAGAAAHRGREQGPPLRVRLRTELRGSPVGLTTSSTFRGRSILLGP